MKYLWILLSSIIMLHTKINLPVHYINVKPKRSTKQRCN